MLNQPVEEVLDKKTLEKTTSKNTEKIEIDETDKIIREKIFHGVDFFFEEFDIMPFVLTRIREIASRIDITNSENQKKIRKAFFVFRSEWWQELESNPMLFSSSRIVFYEEKLTSSKLFTVESFIDTISDCDYDISEVVSEIMRLDEILKKRIADELLCKMPYTLSIPQKIDSLCRDFIASCIKNERDSIFRDFVKQRLDSFNPLF